MELETSNQKLEITIPSLTEEVKRFYELQQYATYLGWKLKYANQFGFNVQPHYELTKDGWFREYCCLKYSFEINVDQSIAMKVDMHGYPNTGMHFLQKFADIYREYAINIAVTWHDHPTDAGLNRIPLK